MPFAKNTLSNYLWLSTIKLGLKSPLLKVNMVGFESSRMKSRTNTGLEVSIQKIEELSLGGTCCLTFTWVPVPSTPHHVHNILWLHGASACDMRTSNQVYPTTRSRGSRAANDVSWTESSYKTTWGLLRLQTQALIFFLTVISSFLSCDCSSCQKHYFLLQIACL